MNNNFYTDAVQLWYYGIGRKIKNDKPLQFSLLLLELRGLI